MSSRVRLVLLVPGDMSVYMKSISGCLEGPHDKKKRRNAVIIYRGCHPENKIG